MKHLQGAVKIISVLGIILFLSGCVKNVFDEQRALRRNTDAKAADSTQDPRDPKVSGANVSLEQELQIIPYEPEPSPIAILHTNKGDITLKFYARHAPKTVENFLKLARGGFYDGVKFHRVINDFMIQTGDPNSKDDDWKDDGQGGPGYTIDDEFNNIKFLRSIVAMAKTALPNSGGSQFFIVTNKHAEWLNGQYTAFAVVTEGMDVVNAIEKVKTTDKYDLPPDHPVEDIVIERVEVRE